jgi:hypothetical protein
VTERAGHAFDVMASAANNELKSYNGVIAVVSIRIPQIHLYLCFFFLVVLSSKLFPSY